MTICLCAAGGVCLLVLLVGSTVGRKQAISMGLSLLMIGAELFSKFKGPKAPVWLLAGTLLALAGCDSITAPRVRPLPVPAAEVPPANLPTQLHVRNWLGPLRQGSCVHASLKNHALWHNDFNFVATWPHSDGETASRVMQRLDAVNYDYVFTERADPRFLDWVSRERHGCILWWKPSHCCTFMGWVEGHNGQQMACVLDNNRPGVYEFHPREQFIRLWAGYGGFGLSFLKPPTVSPPFKSYEVY